MDFTSNAVGAEAPDFVYLGLPAVNASDELSSFGTPATRFGRTADGSNWSAPDCVFGEVTAIGVIKTRSEQNYSLKMVLKLGGKISTLGAKIFL